MSCCNGHNNNNNNSHNDALTVDSNGCFNCDDYAPKVRGRFGLAWVSESPDCPCPEPIGWQVEFLDTPSKVEQKCQEMVRWINCPPLPRCDPCPPDELCCNPCCPPKCNPCAPKCNPCIPKCCPCQRMPCCMCARPPNNKKRERNKCCCCRPKRPPCQPPQQSCCRRRSPRRRPSPQRQYCTCGSDDQQNEQPKCTCDDDVPVKDTDDASGSGSANNICCKYPIYHECIPQQVANETGECRCSSSQNTLMLYENENHIHSTDYYDTCNDEFEDDDGYNEFGEDGDSYYEESCRCSSNGRYNDNDSSNNCYKNRRPKCLKHPNGKKFNGVKKTRSRNSIEKRRKQQPNNSDKRPTKPKTAEERPVKPYTIDQSAKPKTHRERSKKAMNTNEAVLIKRNISDHRPYAVEENIDNPNQVPLIQRVQQVQQMHRADYTLRSDSAHNSQTTIFVQNLTTPLSSFRDLVRISPEQAYASHDKLSIPDDVFIYNKTQSYYSFDNPSKPMYRNINDFHKSAEAMSMDSAKNSFIAPRRYEVRPAQKEVPPKVGKYNEEGTTKRTTKSLKPNQKPQPRYYSKYGCNQDTCPIYRFQDKGCNMATCDYYKGCSRATCKYYKDKQDKQNKQDLQDNDEQKLLELQAAEIRKQIEYERYLEKEKKRLEKRTANAKVEAVEKVAQKDAEVSVPAPETDANAWEYEAQIKDIIPDMIDTDASKSSSPASTNDGSAAAQTKKSALAKRSVTEVVKRKKTNSFIQPGDQRDNLPNLPIAEDITDKLASKAAKKEARKKAGKRNKSKKTEEKKIADDETTKTVTDSNNTNSDSNDTKDNDTEESPPDGVSKYTASSNNAATAIEEEDSGEVKSVKTKKHKHKKKIARAESARSLHANVSRMSRVSRKSIVSKYRPMHAQAALTDSFESRTNRQSVKDPIVVEPQENILMHVTTAMNNPLRRCDYSKCAKPVHSPNYNRGSIQSRNSSLEDFDARLDHSDKNDIVYIINDIPEMPQNSCMYTNMVDNGANKNIYNNGNNTNYVNTANEQSNKRRWFGMDFFKTWCRKDDQKMSKR